MRWGPAEWAPPALQSFESERWHSVCAGSNRFKAFRKEGNMLGMEQNEPFKGDVRRVGSYDNNEWRPVKNGRWIEYVCSVKSETINLNSRVDLRCAWTWFLSQEIISCILQVRLESASHVSGYDTSTRSRLDSLSIPGWWEIYCTGSVSGESGSWQWFCRAINCKFFNNVDSVKSRILSWL